MHNSYHLVTIDGRFVRRLTCVAVLPVQLAASGAEDPRTRIEALKAEMRDLRFGLQADLAAYLSSPDPSPERP